MTTGGTELLVVLAIAVLLFGPKKLPELARTLGHAAGEYHRAQREFEMEVRKTTTAIDKEVTGVTSYDSKTPASKGTASPVASSPKTGPKAKHNSRTQKGNLSSYKVKEIAKNLGIDTANKNDAQILREISLKTKAEKVSKTEK